MDYCENFTPFPQVMGRGDGGGRRERTSRIRWWKEIKAYLYTNFYLNTAGYSQSFNMIS
jgi:hypothetical protein